MGLSQDGRTSLLMMITSNNRSCPLGLKRDQRDYFWRVGNISSVCKCWRSLKWQDFSERLGEELLLLLAELMSFRWMFDFSHGLLCFISSHTYYQYFYGVNYPCLKLLFIQTITSQLLFSHRFTNIIWLHRWPQSWPHITYNVSWITYNPWKRIIIYL